MCVPVGQSQTVRIHHKLEERVVQLLWAGAWCVEEERRRGGKRRRKRRASSLAFFDGWIGGYGGRPETTLLLPPHAQSTSFLFHVSSSAPYLAPSLHHLSINAMIATFPLLVSIIYGFQTAKSMKPHSVLMRRARGYRSQHATAFIAPTHHHTFMMPSTPSLQKKSGVSCMSIRSRDFSSKSHPAFMSMTSINAPSDPSQRSTLDSLSNEEKTIYQELALLSERIRILDSAYYGRESHDVKDLNVTDEEYDALARKEAELCIAYPHLLALLETETGLGSKATRYGGRVGQLYSETESSAESKQNAKPKKKSRSPTKKRIKRQHLANEPMLSLDNAMEEVEAVAWLNRVRKLLLAARQDHIIDEESDVIEFPITISAEPKIDGLSLSLRYELKKDDLIGTTFKFAWASTRGDGTQGEDVTDAVKSAWMGNKTQDETGHYFVPDTIAIQSGDESTPSVIEIRGEVVLPQESFDEFMDTVSKDANATLFSNARNAASGILLRSKEPVSDEELERTRWLQSRLRFYAYDVAPSSVADQIVGTNMQDMRKILLGYGFDVPNPIINETVTISSSNKLNSSDMTNLFTYHHNVMESRDESSLDMERPSYQIDGVVYKLSDFKDRQICGSSSRTPRWAIAHKFPPLSAITRLHKIDVQVGRTGALTPVAILEPVDLGGVLVSRASLHNFHYAKKLLLPKMEDSGHLTTCVRSGVSVLVSRAGDVIPQIIKRVYVDANEEEIDTLRNDDNYTMLSLDPPTNCPACGSPTTFEHVSSTLKQKRRKKENSIAVLDEVLQPTEVDGNITGQVLRCSGPQLLCQPRAVNALAYAYSRSGLDVKGLSKSKLQQLIDNNIIRFPADLFLAFGNTNATKQEGESTATFQLEHMFGYQFFNTAN